MLVSAGLAALSLCSVLFGCDPANSSDTDASDSTMFGLFKKKIPSVVAPELGATLQRQDAYPAATNPSVTPAEGVELETLVDGPPPDARFVDEAVNGRTMRAIRIPAVGQQPPITILNIKTGPGLSACEIWEMDPRQPERFVKRRLAEFDPRQATWLRYGVAGATLQPGGQVVFTLFSVSKQGNDVDLYVYDIAANTARRLSQVQPDWRKGVPFAYTDTIQLTREASVVLYHTDKLLLGAERYANLHDHVLLFSPRSPHGLPVLDLGLDDGNVVRWGAVGKTLWFETVDPRNAKAPATFHWSLDLSRLV